MKKIAIRRAAAVALTLWSMNALALDSHMTFCMNDTNSTVWDPITGFGSPCPAAKRGRIAYESNIGFGADPEKFAQVTKGVITIHGAGGNYGAAYDAVEMNLAGLEEQVWVVAPQFQQYSSLPPTYTDNILQWPNDTHNGWHAGVASGLPFHLEVSSFDVIDRIVMAMKDRAPTITEFVIIGFSRGARTVDRYSMATRIETQYPDTSFRYLISAAGNYLYLDDVRYVSTENQAPPTLATPASGCSTTYNDYPYGLANVPTSGYLAGRLDGGTAFMERAGKLERLFLVGALDNGTPDSCQEAVQGSTRRNAAFAHMHHLRAVGHAKNAHFCLIKKTDHSNEGTVGSHAGRFYWRDHAVDCSLNDDESDYLP